MGAHTCHTLRSNGTRPLSLTHVSRCSYYVIIVMGAITASSLCPPPPCAQGVLYVKAGALRRDQHTPRTSRGPAQPHRSSECTRRSLSIRRRGVGQWQSTCVHWHVAKHIRHPAQRARSEPGQDSGAAQGRGTFSRSHLHLRCKRRRQASTPARLCRGC
jgi:hypothetical protein